MKVKFKSKRFVVAFIRKFVGNMEFIINLAMIGAVLYFVLKRKGIRFQDVAKKMFDASGSESIKAAFNEKTKSYTAASSNSVNKMRMDQKKAWYIFGGIVLLVILWFSIMVIPAGTTGVKHLFGKVNEQELSSGFHLINPLAQVEKMSIRTEEYTMSIAQGEGQRAGADQISALTNEGLMVDLDITVFYHLTESSASDVFKDLGTNFQEKIIRPEIRSAIREIVAKYDAKAIYSDKRGEVALEIQKRLGETIDPRGIAVEQVLLRNVTLPSKLANSIQEKLQAEQESQRYDFVLEREQKEADRKRIEAEGQRDAQSTISQSLTPSYLEYLYIRELKDREGTIYVPIDPNNGLPLFRGIQ